MRLGMIAFGAAALIGAGYVIGKKISENNRKTEEEDAYREFGCDCDGEECEEGEFCEGENSERDGSRVYAKAKVKEYGEKARKASMFAVGAIKTSADKLGETIKDIKTNDMVKKGEQTFGAVKETGGNIKNDIKRDIEDLKDMVSSIEDDVKESEVFQKVENTVETVVDDVAGEVKNVFGKRDDDSRQH